MNKAITMTYSSLVDRIAQILVQARNNVVRQINRTQVLAYWEIGREIVEFEQKGKARAEYGENLLMKLSADMTARFGRGFSAENLRLMRKFYITFRKSKTLSWKSDSKKYQTLSVKSEKQQTLSTKFEPMLSWSHYCELLKVEEALTRSFYEQEAIQNNWSVRELKRQINSMLFERLAFSKDVKAVMRMAEKGQIIEKPEDAIKDPYILEFLNLREETAYSESQLEQAIIDKLQCFLLELGKGFSFVARQKRITITNRHYHIDLVFYNRILKCFVLIDLKTGELDHSDIGQIHPVRYTVLKICIMFIFYKIEQNIERLYIMELSNGVNFYLNYFKENEKAEGENDPIGLILCAKKDDIFAKYVLGGLSNKIFASKYKLALPSEQELRSKLKSIPLVLSKSGNKLKSE